MSDHSDPERGFMGGAAADKGGKAAEETSPASMTSETRIAMATARVTADRPLPPRETWVDRYLQVRERSEPDHRDGNPSNRLTRGLSREQYLNNVGRIAWQFGVSRVPVAVEALRNLL